jgi:biofilm PGA synthesis protein PgaA
MESLKIMHQDMRTHLILLLIVYMLLPAAALRAGERNILSVGAQYPDVLQKVKELTDKGDNSEAMRMLTPFISDPEKYPAAVSDYIAILVWEGRGDEAIRMYKGLPSSFPRRAYLLRNIAKAYYEKKNFLSAFSLYKKSLEQMPQDGEVRKGVVYALMQMGAYKNADDYLERFLTEAPGSVQLLLVKAQLLVLQNSYMEALKIYNILAERSGSDREFIYKSKENVIASLTEEKRHALAAALSKSVQSGEKEAIADYVLILIINKEYTTALRAFEVSGAQIDNYPENSQSWISWAYFKTGNTSRAKQFYQKILAEKPDYARAKIGLAYCLAQEGRYDEATEILDRLQRSDTQDTEIMYARAFVFETSQRFWQAVEEYNRILRIDPENEVAKRLKILALTDAGASSFASEKAKETFPSDLELRERIHDDMAVHSINWQEPRNAVSILLPQKQFSENIRARYDLVVAYYESGEMAEAVRSYEAFKAEGATVPDYVTESAAKAYLELEQPQKSLKLYDQLLKDKPDSPDTYDTRLGKFYALQEIREWGEAKELISDLDKETPETIRPGNQVRPNWSKVELKITEGWFLLYEDRLREAEEFFTDLRERAPGNAGFRTGLAYTYLWRGWPRRALREFNISASMDEKDTTVQVGKAFALNSLARKEEAREEAKALLKDHPDNRHVMDLNRQLKVEEMQEIKADFDASYDDDGVTDIRSGLRITRPVSLYTDVYGSIYFQRSESSHDSLASHFHRAALGADHVFNSSWELRQEFSADYDNAKDFGSLTEINFTPDDHWNFGLLYDSFTTDVPLKARIFDIDADEIKADVAFRESEWRTYRLSMSRMKFSDDNKRLSWLFGYEQGLYVRNNWKMRMFLDLYRSSNSSDDSPYFNPKSDLSVNLTHMTEHTIYRIYRRSFLQRLFLSVGDYSQREFSNYMTGSVRYEHDLEFSDLHALLYGVSVARQVYDGEAVTSYGFYLTWRYLF